MSPVICFQFCNNMDVQKVPKGPPFYIFGTKRHTGDFKKVFPHSGSVEENTCHFEVFLLFLSLRYGSDLGSSRFVIKLKMVLKNSHSSQDNAQFRYSANLYENIRMRRPTRLANLYNFVDFDWLQKN